MSDLVKVTLDDVQLVDSPINPEWIIEGEPRARVGEWSRSLDGTTMTAVWSCTAGTFRWHFECDEIVQILEGSVTVTGDDGDSVILNVGDAALFRAGSAPVWRVDDYVRKHAIVREVVPTPVRFGWRILRRLHALVTHRRAQPRAAL